MKPHRRVGLGAVLVVVLGTAAAGAATPHFSSSTRFPAGAVGSDVSYPQCNPDDRGAVKTPATGQFGIVGLTKGLPFQNSDCALSEWTDANTLPDAPQLYVNTANPAPKSSFYWPKSGARDPKLCINARSVSDPGCAYDYGWHSVESAMTDAINAGITAAKVETWWLDVEADNTWNGTTTANAADLQGAADYLRSQGVPAVGIYTSPSAWTAVTGGYDRANATKYAKAWRSEFTPAFPLTASPGWTLGIGTKSSAVKACAVASPLGTATWLAQYAGTIDQDLACPTQSAPSFTLATSTTKLTATRGHPRSIKVKVTETGLHQPVHLTVKRPADLKARLSSSLFSTTGTVVLTVTPRAHAASGVHHITITATGSTAVRTKSVTVKVR